MEKRRRGQNEGKKRNMQEERKSHDKKRGSERIDGVKEGKRNEDKDTEE